jgi:dephospho-CoA kinase
MTQQRLIGLTGGIATGKSTVARYLSETYQLPILDADLYAREAVTPNSPILDQIFERYGKPVKHPNGALNRQGLGEIIFNDSAEKTWLESQIHPYVRRCFEEQLKLLKNPIIVLVIPLLFEVKMTDLVTETWVIYCDFQEQVKRLRERNQLTEEQAIARINSQMSLDEKIKLGDVTLDNSQTLEDLFKQIDVLISNQ